MPAVQVKVVLGDGREPVLVPIIESSFAIESVLGQVIDTLDVTLHDKNRLFKGPVDLANYNAPNTKLDTQILRDIIVENPNLPDPDNNRIFGGIVSDIEGSVVGPTAYFNISAQDYTILLDRTLAFQSFPPNYIFTDDETGERLQGDKGLIAGAFERSIVGVGGATGQKSEISVRRFVEQGLPNLSQQDFKYSTLREVLSQIAQYVGYEFYVDFYKELHYFYRETFDAPYELTDGPASATAVNYRDISWRRDGTRVINTFALFGDRLLADEQTAVFAASGFQREFDLAFSTVFTNYALIGPAGSRSIVVQINAGNDRGLTANVHTGSVQSAVLEVAGGNFISDGVNARRFADDGSRIPGDVVVNTTDGSWGEITSLTDTSMVAILRGGTNNYWSPGDRASVPTWSDLTVTNNAILGIQNFQVFHNVGERQLTFTSPPPNSRYAVRLQYSHNFVGGQIDSDYESIRRYGRVLSRRIIAGDVNSAQGLRQKLEYLKRQYSDALEVVKVKITDDMFPTNDPRRFAPGQWVRFTSRVLDDGTGRLIRKEFLINRVTTRILGGSRLEYELECRDWEVDL